MHSLTSAHQSHRQQRSTNIKRPLRGPGAVLNIVNWLTARILHKWGAYYGKKVKNIKSCVIAAQV